MMIKIPIRIEMEMEMMMMMLFGEEEKIYFTRIEP